MGNVAVLVSNISSSYLENIKDASKLGDLIKTEIIKIEPGIIDVTTKKPQLGILTAYCSNCRNRMILDNKDNSRSDIKSVICLKCKNVEKRKVSTEYI
jgi:exosome complex component CSL4